MRFLLLLLFLTIHIGCSTVHHGSRETPHASSGQKRGQIPPPQELGAIYLAPLNNATDDLHAHHALKEILATTLLKHGFPHRNLSLPQKLDEVGLPVDPSEKDFIEAAKNEGADFLVTGTVHEYRYKSDLDGDPAVGVSVRLVRVADGLTVWQSTASQVGVGFSSLTSASMKALSDMLVNFPRKITLPLLPSKSEPLPDIPPDQNPDEREQTPDAPEEPQQPEAVGSY